MTPSNTSAPVIGFAAHSGSGKTTLLKKLIPKLKDQGIKIGLVKHAHCGFEMDIPGKDSYELRKAGASQVIIGSKLRWAHIVETPENEENVALTSLIERFDYSDLDLIVVEGFKLENLPKIEVFRPSLGKPQLSAQQAGYIAVACDEVLASEKQLPVLDLNNIDQIAGFILQFMQHN